MSRNTSILFALTALLAVGCDSDGDGVSNGDDCAPDNADVSPDAEEICDGIDNNCDGTVDGDDPAVDLSTATTYYADADGDGYGDPASTEDSCSTPANFVDNDADCDDTNPDLNPETVWYGDLDGDGYGDDLYTELSCEVVAGHSLQSGDCDENDVAINPGADEYCDTIDNNCDGTVDEATALDALTWYEDTDGDGYGDDTVSVVECYEPSGYSIDGGDCDTTDATAFPGADELCDGVDNDCDTVADLDASVPTDYATIQDAINGLADGSSFCVDAGTYTETLDFGGKSMEIVGNGAGSTILDAEYSGRHFSITDGETVSIREMDIMGGENSSGAVAYVSGGSTLTLKGIYFTDNWFTSGYSYGGTVYVTGGTVNIEDSEFDGIWAQPTGTYGSTYCGIVYATSSSTVNVTNVDVHDSLFAAADATSSYYFYGVFYMSSSDLTLDNVTFTDNAIEAPYNIQGGFIYASSSTVVANDVDFSGNSLTAEGYSNGLTDVGGGLIYNYQSDAEFNHLTMIGNDMTMGDDLFGLIAYGYYGSLVLNNGIVAGNTATCTNAYSGVSETNGGLVYHSYASDTEVTNSDLSYNTYDGYYYNYTAGFYNSSNSSVDVLNSNIVGNEAVNPLSTSSNTAGVIYNASSTATYSFEYSNYYGNEPNSGNGFYDFWDSTTSDEADLSGFAGVLNVDPEYTDVSSSDAADWDMTLQSSSAGVDAGSPDILDVDGTTSDLGAYGGPDPLL